MVTNAVTDILVTVVTKGYVPVVTFDTQVTSVNWLLWLCEHARLLFSAEIPTLLHLKLIS